MKRGEGILQGHKQPAMHTLTATVSIEKQSSFKNNKTHAQVHMARYKSSV